jgi:hypothetical protein
MLTVHVSNTELESRIEHQAREAGKTAQQLVEELLEQAFAQPHPTFSYPRLNPAKHLTQLTFPKNEVAKSDDSPAFQHVTDTISFVEALRRTSWSRR